jgi:PAS domain-containing protein
VSFYSKEKAYYKEPHRELLMTLPMDKAVRLALYQQKEEESKFFDEVIHKMSAEGKDFVKVAETLVEDLSVHYGWGNVAFFRADEDLNLFRLLYQKSSPETQEIPEGYTQPLNEGVLGWVYEKKEDVNIGDAREDLRFKGIYISPWKKIGSNWEDTTGSEICLLLTTEHACFILNIEDPTLDAFSDKEFSALKRFRDQAKTILEHSWITHALSAALEITSEAIIFTDRQGRITKANPAAVYLLGHTEEKEMKGLLLKDLFQDAKLAEKAIHERYFPTQEVIWLDKFKKSVRLLLSASALPEKEFGSKIFTGKSLAEKDWVERLGHLEKLYQEIAIQMKTPLSLAFSWLKGVIHKNRESEEAIVLDKVIRQLRKVDLTFDRLSLYDYDEKRGWFPAHKLELGFEEVLQKVRDDLPECDWERIVDSSPPPLPILRADLFQLTFCVETILAHLLQVIPEDDKVQMKVSSPGERIIMEFSGNCLENVRDDEAKDSPLNRALAAIATGENLIDRFMREHDGEYQKRREGSRTVFCLIFPAV